MSEATNPSLEEQLIKYGYFPEQVPPCFHTDKLYDQFKKLEPKHLGGVSSSEPLSITMSKNDHNRRVIMIPNPIHQIKLFKYIIDNKKDLYSLIGKNENTLSNPFLEEYINYQEIEIFDIPLLRDTTKIRSRYLDGLSNKISTSMGYRIMYKLDIANFYDSIYTHSIEWAIVGKEHAKYKRSKNIGQKLDELVRNTNFKETSGIPTGPFSSRIISEIILNKIDEELRNLSLDENVDFSFVHYVDDYEFYFRNESDFNKMINKIRRIFEGFRLRINENKSELKTYPFHSNKDLQEEFNYYLIKFRKTKNSHYLRLLFFKADEIVEEGNKGGYKYLYKLLKGEDMSNAWHSVEPFLIGHILIRPELSQYINPIVLKHKEYISCDLKKELMKNLEISVEQELENEAQWLLWIIISLDIKIDANKISVLLKKTNDDILRVMLIQNAFLRGQQNSVRINNEINRLFEDIKDKDLSSDRWLLLYEWIFNKWPRYKELKKKLHVLFSVLHEKGVNFFDLGRS